ncbi:MAG: 5-(carboxyamino)imidazole ribonucleotide mutase [Planctomycetes bacterium]|nr:5-(carboxyamino)imidazole ribonucleotide mutase [Planctomycetota bacterium]
MSASILILMGSDSDYSAMSATLAVLDQFSVPFDCHVASAHRSPQRVEQLVSAAEASGVKLVICAAGMAAHLAGVVAGKTILPVIGVPMESPHLAGIDSLYSTVMMPPGIPVATVGIGTPGAKNAAWLALAILALGDPTLKTKLQAWRAGLSSAVAEADARLQLKLAERPSKP